MCKKICAGFFIINWARVAVAQNTADVTSTASTVFDYSTPVNTPTDTTESSNIGNTTMAETVPEATTFGSISKHEDFWLMTSLFLFAIKMLH